MYGRGNHISLSPNLFFAFLVFIKEKRKENSGGKEREANKILTRNIESTRDAGLISLSG